jgi:GT2 family glycosyltransferase
MTDLSIVIVSHNTKKLLADCLNAVTQQISGVLYEVIVIDNASIDGSCEMVRKEFPSVNLIENHTNPGFSAANNQGMRLSKTPIIICLNPDTIVLPGIITEVKNAFDLNPHIGALGIRILNPNHSIQPSWGVFSSAWTEFFFQCFLYKLFPSPFPLGKEIHPLQKRSYQYAHRVDWVSGAFLAVRRCVFYKTEGFDENIFLYGEDMEWCWRIWKAGFQVWFWPEAEVIHFNKSASNRNFENWISNYTQGILYFVKLNRSRRTLLLCGLFVILGSILRQALWGGFFLVDPTRRGEISQRLSGYRNAIRLGLQAITKIQDIH